MIRIICSLFFLLNEVAHAGAKPSRPQPQTPSQPQPQTPSTPAQPAPDVTPPPNTPSVTPSFPQSPSQNPNSTPIPLSTTQPQTSQLATLETGIALGVVGTGLALNAADLYTTIKNFFKKKSTPSIIPSDPVDDSAPKKRSVAPNEQPFINITPSDKSSHILEPSKINIPHSLKENVNLIKSLEEAHKFLDSKESEKLPHDLSNFVKHSIEAIFENKLTIEDSIRILDDLNEKAKKQGKSFVEFETHKQCLLCLKEIINNSSKLKQDIVSQEPSIQKALPFFRGIVPKMKYIEMTPPFQYKLEYSINAPDWDKAYPDIYKAYQDYYTKLMSHGATEHLMKVEKVFKDHFGENLPHEAQTILHNLQRIPAFKSPLNQFLGNQIIEELNPEDGIKLLKKLEEHEIFSPHEQATVKKFADELKLAKENPVFAKAFHAYYREFREVLELAEKAPQNLNQTESKLFLPAIGPAFNAVFEGKITPQEHLQILEYLENNIKDINTKVSTFAAHKAYFQYLNEAFSTDAGKKVLETLQNHTLDPRVRIAIQSLFSTVPSYLSKKPLHFSQKFLIELNTYFHAITDPDLKEATREAAMDYITKAIRHGVSEHKHALTKALKHYYGADIPKEAQEIIDKVKTLDGLKGQVNDSFMDHLTKAADNPKSGITHRDVYKVLYTLKDKGVLPEDFMEHEQKKHVIESTGDANRIAREYSIPKNITDILHDHMHTYMLAKDAKGHLPPETLNKLHEELSQKVKDALKDLPPKQQPKLFQIEKVINHFYKEEHARFKELGHNPPEHAFKFEFKAL